MRRTRHSGFTLIELVMVIVILGIVSVSAVGLFATRGDFASAVVKDQLLSNLRLAQQAALARQDTAINGVTLSIGTSGTQWLIQGTQGATLLFDSLIDKDGTDIRTSTTVFSGACSTLPVAASITLVFDRNGDSLPAAKRRLCIIGDSNYELCVSSAGYAHEGACIE